MARRLLPISSAEDLEPPSVVWTHEEWKRIRQGHQSRDMDDKWDIVVDGDRLDFHRSWTGQCVYRAWFTQEAAGWRISRSQVAGNRAQYRRASDAAERLLVELLIRELLLGEHRPDLWERWSEMIRKETWTQ